SATGDVVTELQPSILQHRDKAEDAGGLAALLVPRRNPVKSGECDSKPLCFQIDRRLEPLRAVDVFNPDYLGPEIANRLYDLEAHLFWRKTISDNFNDVERVLVPVTNHYDGVISRLRIHISQVNDHEEAGAARHIERIDECFD